MPALSERLEVRLPPPTMQRLRREARRRGISIGALVREALDRLFEAERQTRLDAAEALFRVGAPVADWPAMKREIEEARRGADR
ncbi:MAG: ribbon-helix-helix protein, CopG family [Chloroflexi bacterium]|nr:ribbon-helix-helix protein, CopG family [Chloroflexota bacterium]